MHEQIVVEYRTTNKSLWLSRNIALVELEWLTLVRAQRIKLKPKRENHVENSKIKHEFS